MLFNINRGEEPVPFDIHQKVIDPYSGEVMHEVSEDYQDELIKRFAASPEGRNLVEESGGTCAWYSDAFLSYAIGHLGLTPPEMTPSDLHEVVFDIFPRKVSVRADKAKDIIHELGVFWSFLQREFGLENAAAMLEILENDRALQTLQEELEDPANYGMAKSVVMTAMERGVDVTNQEEMNEWIKIYNEEISAGLSLPLPPSDPLSMGEGWTSSKKKQPAKAKAKAKRKQSQASRKINRKKR
jgi:hypothetical protein